MNNIKKQKMKEKQEIEELEVFYNKLEHEGLGISVGFKYAPKEYLDELEKGLGFAAWKLGKSMEAFSDAIKQITR